MIRVLLVDDSATAREVLRAILEHDPDVRVIGEAHDGIEAVRMAEELAPDLIVMDVHIPGADGITATREIMHRAPTPILIVSAVGDRDVDLSLTATQAGALMALPKPESPNSPRFAGAASELRQMARAMAGVRVVRRWSRAPGGAAPPPRRGRAGRRPPTLIAMAASTGGPAALRQVLVDLPAGLTVPILIVQHIARDFTAGFATWLARGLGHEVVLAAHGQALRPGTVYVGPEDRHLGVDAEGRVELGAEPPRNGFRPSASHLFESAARAYGPRLAAVVLTGMGSDGADGLVAARAAGGFVIAQDEATSVVFGMAQEAVRRGAVDAVLPLEQIAPRLVSLLEVDTRGD